MLSLYRAVCYRAKCLLYGLDDAAGHLRIIQSCAQNFLASFCEIFHFRVHQTTIEAVNWQSATETCEHF